MKCSKLIEFVRGAQTVATSLGQAVLLLGISPLSWHVEMTNTIGSIILTHDKLAPDDLKALENRNPPFICVPNLKLIGNDNDFFHCGSCTANDLFRAAITGGQLIS